MALIHRGPVLGWASWNAVKQQNERADTVEKSAAKEHEASVRYIFRGTFFAAAVINWGCFMVHSETYITYLVLNTMHREVCSRAGWLMCLSPTEKFKKELADASRVANRLIFQLIGSLILTESRQIILTGERFMLTWVVVCNNSWDGGGSSRCQKCGCYVCCFHSWAGKCVFNGLDEEQWWLHAGVTLFTACMSQPKPQLSLLILELPFWQQRALGQ